MNLLDAIDAELQKDLVNFIKAQHEKEKQGNFTFGEYMVPEMLKMMISGKCRMTGCAKNDSTGKMWCEFSFYDTETEGENK